MIPFVTFRPAEYHKGKESYVSYYVADPMTQKLTRKKIKLNRIKKATEREKYATVLCHRINEKLYAGWNPLLEQTGGSSSSVSEAVAKFLKSKEKTCRPDTMRSYRSFSHTFLQWCGIVGLANAQCIQVEYEHLQRFMDWAERISDLSNRSWNNYASFLFTLFDYCTDRGYTLSNPAEKLPRRKVDRKQRTVIPKADRAVILKYFMESCPRYVAVMQMCFRLFIRPKEICMLRICDIDYNEQTIRIPSNVAKNHNERVLGVPDCLMEYFREIADYPHTYYIYGDKNTFAPGPKRIYPTRIAERWKTMRNELKLPASYQFYSLKDTGITEMLEAGVPPKYVKELADHHSLEMTERYTHRSEAKKILEWNTLEF